MSLLRSRFIERIGQTKCTCNVNLWGRPVDAERQRKWDVVELGGIREIAGSDIFLQFEYVVSYRAMPARVSP